MTCESCRFFEVYRGLFTCTGWTGDGSQGRCCREPRTVPVATDRPACGSYQAVR